MPDSWDSQAIRAVRWATLGEILPKLAAPISLIVLARLLSPEDFGVVAAATVVVSFSQLFWDAGLTKALIHRQGDIASASQTVFWTNLAIACVICAGVYPAAPWIAEYVFSDARVASVLRVMSIVIVIQSLGAVPQALFQRELNFRRIFWISIPNAMSPLVISIPLALAGASYWALIASHLTAAVAQLVLLYLSSGWRPHLQFDTKHVVRLASYGGWVSGSSLLGWLFQWLDALLIGAFFGTSTLGAYTVANNLVSSVFATVFTPISNVLFPMLSRLQSDFDRLKQTFLTVSKLTGIVAIGLLTPIALLSEDIVQVLFGARWSSSAVFLMFLTLCQGLAWTVSLNGLAYRAIGRPDAEFKVMSISMAVRIFFYTASISFGVGALMASRLASVTLGAANHIWFAGRMLNTGYSYYFSNTLRAYLAAACAALAYVALFDPMLDSFPAAVRLIAGGAAVVSVFLVVLLPLEGDFLMRVLPRLLASQRTKNV
jgi:PST family polysaccharide transporter